MDLTGLEAFATNIVPGYVKGEQAQANLDSTKTSNALSQELLQQRQLDTQQMQANAQSDISYANSLAALAQQFNVQPGQPAPQAPGQPSQPAAQPSSLQTSSGQPAQPPGAPWPSGTPQPPQVQAPQPAPQPQAQPSQVSAAPQQAQATPQAAPPPAGAPQPQAQPRPPAPMTPPVQGQPGTPPAPGQPPQGAAPQRPQPSPQQQAGAAKQIAQVAEQKTAPATAQAEGSMSMPQLAALVMKANRWTPQQIASNPQVARAFAITMERMQKFLTADGKQAFAEQKITMEYDAKIAKIQADSDNAVKKAESAQQVAEIKAASAQAVADIARAKAENVANIGADTKKDVAAQTNETKKDIAADTNQTKKDLQTEKDTAAGQRLDKTLAEREAVAKANNDAKAALAAGAMPKPETIATLGKYLYETGQMPSQGMGNPKVRAAIEDAAQAYGESQGGDVATSMAQNKARYNAGQAAARAIAVQGGRISIGTNEINQFAPYMLDAAGRINKSQYSNVNALHQAASRRMGGQDVVDLDNWIQALKSAYAQVLVRGGTATNKARERADEVINEAYSKNQLAAIVRDLQNEGAGAKKAAGTAENEAISKGSGGGDSSADTSGGSGNVSAPGDQGDVDTSNPLLK